MANPIDNITEIKRSKTLNGNPHVRGEQVHFRVIPSRSGLSGKVAG